MPELAVWASGTESTDASKIIKLCCLLSAPGCSTPLVQRVDLSFKASPCTHGVTPKITPKPVYIGSGDDGSGQPRVPDHQDIIDDNCTSRPLAPRDGLSAKALGRAYLPPGVAARFGPDGFKRPEYDQLRIFILIGTSRRRPGQLVDSDDLHACTNVAVQRQRWGAPPNVEGKRRGWEAAASRS